MKVSHLAETLTGSEIIKIAGEINELKKQGEQITNLTIGDFNPEIYPIPEALTSNIVDAYNDHQTNYPPADGILPLRQKVSELLKEEYGLSFSPNEILISSGSRPLIYGTYLALVDPGDKVLYPAPSWNNNHYCHLTNANAIAIPVTEKSNFLPTAEDIRPHVKDAVMLAVCSPLNPTGTMFSAEGLAEICDVIIEENKTRTTDQKPLYLLYDQIYSLLTFGKKHYDPVSLRPEMKDYVVYIDGASKCFAATGVRVGWGFGPEHIISKMRSIVGHMGAWAPKAEQVATAKFLGQKKEMSGFLEDFKSKIQQSLNALYKGFMDMKADGLNVDAIEPMGAIYLTIKIDYAGTKTASGEILKTSSDINFYLINKAKVAFVPFAAFGTETSINWFRASVGATTCEDIEQMLPRLKNALKTLT